MLKEEILKKNHKKNKQNKSYYHSSRIKKNDM